jgi:hypothetical protein
MTKQQVQSFWRFLWIGLSLGACLLLSSTVSLGEIKSTSSVNDCRLVANPDECYRNQGRQKWSQYNPSLPALNTELFGLEGPVRAELKYDAELSWILGMQYMHMFNESAGIAAKLTGGPNEFRTNLTAGYALGKDHQVKLTYEYLTQNLPFDFASGTINNWVAQHSLGAAYQYVVRHEILHSLELSGYATRANSKDLDTVTFNQQTVVPGADYLYDVNYRRIAGGKENTVLASINLFPFATATTTLTLGAGYSSISYDTRYEDDQAATRPAYKAELAHLLSSKAKVMAGTTSTAGSTEHSVGVSHLLPSNFELSVKGQYTSGQGTLKDNKSLTLGITYPAPDNYSLAGFSEVQELKNWIDKPIVYATRVLAIKDELVKRFEVKNAATLADQEKFFFDQLTPVPSTSAFSFDAGLSATYTVLVEKVSPNNVQNNVSSNRDYTKDLNLTLVVNGNQATLQSATSAGIPPTDTTGASTEGIYKVTITANVMIGGGKTPVVLQNGFKLTVKGPHTPDWDETGIPDAQMGFPYPPVTQSAHDVNGPAKNSNGLEDLTAKVTIHPPDTSAVFSIVEGPTSWLTIKDCATPAGHQCLAATKVPKSSPADTFSVTVRATPMPSGDNPSQKTFTAKIVQVLPEWTMPATPAIDINGSQEQKTLHLANYITAGKIGLTFVEGPGFDTANWALDSSGDLKFIGTNPDYLGLKSVPVIALNDTSYAGASKDIPVNVYNSLFTVDWIGNKLPDAEAGSPYNKNLNDLSDIINPLLRTLNGTTPVTTDQYDFEIIGTPTQGEWKKPLDPDAAGAIGLLTGTNLKVGSVDIVFRAKSHDANKYATPEEKTVTLNVTQNHSLNPAWTGEKELKSWTAGTADYSENLAAPASGKVLVETFSGTLPLDPPDTYLFKLASVLPENWHFDESTKLLTNALPLRGTYSFLFTAQSDQAGELATGGTGGDAEGTQQLLTVSVTADPTLNVTWSRSDYPIHVPAGTPYTSADLNTLKAIDPSYALVKTTKDTTLINADIYAFTKISSEGDWDVPTGSNVLKNSEPMVGQTNRIILTAKSFQADKLAAGDNVPGHPDQQAIAIIVDPNPQLDVTWIKDSLPKVGKAGAQYTQDLAALQGTVDALVATQNSPHDTYTFTVVGQSADPKPGEWYIPAGTSILTNDSPAPAPDGVIVSLQAVSKQAGKAATGGSQGKILVKIAADPNLTVKWTGAKDISEVATTARPYAVDLNELNRDKNPELVQTLSSGSPISGDDYTFTVIGQKPTPEPGDWYIRSGETILRNDAAPAQATGEKAHVTLGVKSTRAPDATATGGDAPGNPSQQIINITVTQNADFAVSWTGDDTLSQQGSVGKKYQQDLNNSPAVGSKPLVVTRDGTLPFGDSYTFAVVGQSPTPQPGDWYVPDGKTLTNDNPALGIATKVLLSVKSNTSPETVVTGGNGPGSDQTTRYITVVINPDPGIEVKWIQGKPLPITAKAGEMIDPLSLNAAQLVATTGHPEDTYQFSFPADFNPPAGWSIDETNHNTLKKATIALVGEEPLIFEADSTVAAPAQAQGGNVPGHPNQQLYTVVTEANPALNVNWTAVNSLPEAKAGELYGSDNPVDLTNAIRLQPTGFPLVTTKNSQGTDISSSDTYTYTTTDPNDPIWTVADNVLTSKVPLLVTGAEPRTIQVHLTAKSKQAGDTVVATGGSEGVFNIVIKPNPQTLIPKWTGAHKVMPNATAFDTSYSVDLASFSEPMVKTTNKEGVVIADTYTFKQVGDGTQYPVLTDWDIVNNKLVYTGDPTLGPKPQTGGYQMAIQATSTQAYPEVAIEGDGPSGKTQIITITVDPNPALNVKWKQDTFPRVARAGETYLIQDFNQVTPVFVQTDRAGTIVKENYAYHLKVNTPTPAPPTRGVWTFDEANNKLTVSGLIPDTDAGGEGAKAYFSAFSKAKSSDAENMTGLDPRNDQPLTLHVVTNPDLKPQWTANPTLTGDPSVTTYTVDLNEYNTTTQPKTLVFTTPADDDPYYDFTFVSISQGSCEPIGTGLGGRLGKLTCKDVGVGDVTLKLKAWSRNSGQYAAITKGAEDSQEVILKMPAVPVITPTEKPVQFDKISVTGTPVETDLNLNDLISNREQFKALNFSWCKTGTTPLQCDSTVLPPAHWQFVENGQETKQGTTRTNYTLVRTKDTSTTPNAVYALDVGTSLGPAEGFVMKVVGIIDGKESTPAYIGQGANIVKANVTPDPTVKYKYADAEPATACTKGTAACNLVAVTSNGTGGSAKYDNQPVFPDMPVATLKTFLQDDTPVIDDYSAATFLTNSTTPSFMKLAGNKLTFEAPTAADFNDHAGKPFTTYLRIQSKASGSENLPDTNLNFLPPVNLTKLILVPSQEAVNKNNSFVPGNMGANVFVGISPTQLKSASACAPNFVTTVTSLRFNLPRAPTGYHYVLTALTPQWRSGDISTSREAFVCTGITPTSIPIDFKSFAGADGNPYCGNTAHNQTWDATAVRPSGGKATRCGGSGGHPVDLPNTPFTGGSYNLGVGGPESQYLIALAAQGYNSGLTNNFAGGGAVVEPSAIPNPPGQTELGPIFKDTMSNYPQLLDRNVAPATRGGRIAPMLGTSYGSYTDFPMIELLPDKS